MPDRSLYTAVLDACVLYPPSLRDLFLRLAGALVYQPRWTEAIHAEWIENVLADRPDVSRAALERTRRLIDAISDEALVTDYEDLIPTLTLPDPDDRHVLAAAIRAGASVIVTFNRRDFPASALAPHGVRAMAPDVYLCALFDDAPDLFVEGVRSHRAALKRPPKSAEEYGSTLRANRLPKLAERLETRAGEW